MKQHAHILLAVVFLLVGCSNKPTTSPTSQTLSESNITECTDGMVGDTYPCKNVDLVAHVSVEDLLAAPLQSGLALNDVWGWTDPQTGTEYALVGLNDGVTFVDLSTPSNPVVVGKLNETAAVSESAQNNSFGNSFMYHEGKSSWRDMKVYQNHMYVVSDGQPHGMQVFDLAQLRNVENPPVTFSEDVLYEAFGDAHNIAINEQTGFAYVGGSDTYGGGLHIVDIRTPLDPQFAGFHSDSTVGADSTGYVHDMQCVNYRGPDADYAGEEICMNASETHLVVANVTEKQNTNTISKATYEGNAYAHQGWLTEDHRYFLLDDEFDELQGSPTTTYIWDVRNLDNPEQIGAYESSLSAIDHNQYVKGHYVYQANYTSGLRILSLTNIDEGKLQEGAYFDTFPSSNEADFDGAWSNYPFFESGLILVSDISNGLFILKPNLD